MTLPDLVCGLLISGKMHMMPLAFPDSFGANGREETRGRSVEKPLRRHLRSVAKRDFDGVSLARANLPAIVAEGESLLLIGGDNLFQLGALNGHAMLPASGEESFDLRPSARVQCQSNPLGFVTQDEAQELARPGSLFLIHIRSSSVRWEQPSDSMGEHDAEEDEIAQWDGGPEAADWAKG